jgi:hypothetical protein
MPRNMSLPEATLLVFEMILYKYVPFETGKKILTMRSIRFSQPEKFNDPFDRPAYPYTDDSQHLGGLAGEARVAHRLRLMEWERAWAQCTGILCLTRTPTNPLMWAHYADSHKGIVIGIDAVWAGLTDEAANLIPAQYGSVVYVSRRSQEPFITAPNSVMTIGGTHHFLSDQYERLQRLFLHKPLCWSYEEEVRVVKSVDGIPGKGGRTQSGQFAIETGSDDCPIYLYTLSPGSIRELYFGYALDIEIADVLYCETKKLHPKLSVYDCMLAGNTLTIGYQKYTTLAEAGRIE